MIITNGKQIDKKAIRQLWDKCFDEDSVSWRDWYFENIFDIKNIVGAKENGQLISMVHMNPYPIAMRNSRIATFALSGVATNEQHRGRGYAGNLIKYALNKAYLVGYDFSFLYPFKYEYYEKFGYSLGYNKYKYIQEYDAKANDEQIIVHEMFSDEYLAKIYAKFVSEKNGFVLRNGAYYSVHIKELLCDKNKIVCFSLGGKAGYFCIDESKQLVEEMAYEGSQSSAIKAITRYLKKDTGFENLYDLDDLIGIKERHCMGRVISVMSIFRKLKLKKVDIKIRISDDIIEDNNGVWHIKSTGYKAVIAKTNESADYTIDILKLTPIITGLNGSCDKDVVEIQNLLFDPTIPFIYEVC